MRNLSYMKNRSWLESRTRHGAYSGGKESSTHAVWRSMLARCMRPSAKDYKRYGGRGIKVCARWLSFDNFLEDMGERPDGMSLDRIDNDGGYEPGNCRWATRSQQQKNKTGTRWFAQRGQLGTLVEWSEHLGLSKQLLLWRWKNWGTFVKGDIWLELQRG